MLNSKFSRFFVCFCLGLILSVPAAWGYHCADPHFSSKKCRIAHSYANSDVIFMGQLLSVDERLSDSGLPVFTSEFFVKESYRGGVTGQIKIFSEGGVNPPQNIAGHYIVFAIKAGTGKYFSNPCSNYRFVPIETPLVDTPMQTQLRRIATTTDWSFSDEGCVAQKTTFIKPHEKHITHQDAVYDTRNQED